MAKYIYKIDEDNKIVSLKVIERLHPFVGKISERYKNCNIYYVRYVLRQKILVMVLPVLQVSSFIKNM